MPWNFGLNVIVRMAIKMSRYFIELPFRGKQFAISILIVELLKIHLMLVFHCIYFTIFLNSAVCFPVTMCALSLSPYKKMEFSFTEINLPLYLLFPVIMKFLKNFFSSISHQMKTLVRGTSKYPLNTIASLACSLPCSILSSFWQEKWLTNLFTEFIARWLLLLQKCKFD